MKCSKEAGRIMLWMAYVTVWLITSIYVAIAVIVFAQLWNAASSLQYGTYELARNRTWRSPLTALALSALLVFGFNMMSCVTLIKKSINRGGPGFSYGFMVAFSFSLSFFLLLCGLVLDGFRDQVSSVLEVQRADNGTLISGAASWTPWDSSGFVGTEVLALVCFVTYLLFAVVLVVLQTAVSDHLGIEGNGASGKYGVDTVEGMVVQEPLHHPSDGPAAPPDYDQYAQEYAGYEQYEQQQQHQQQNQQQQQQQVPAGYYQQGAAAGYQAPVNMAPVAPPPDDYYPQQGYVQQQAKGPAMPPEYMQAYAPPIQQAPVMYAGAGFAAINAFNTATPVDDGGRSRPPTVQGQHSEI